MTRANVRRWVRAKLCPAKFRPWSLRAAMYLAVHPGPRTGVASLVAEMTANPKLFFPPCGIPTCPVCGAGLVVAIPKLSCPNPECGWRTRTDLKRAGSVESNEGGTARATEEKS